MSKVSVEYSKQEKKPYFLSFASMSESKFHSISTYNYTACSDGAECHIFAQFFKVVHDSYLLKLCFVEH